MKRLGIVLGFAMLAGCGEDETPIVKERVPRALLSDKQGMAEEARGRVIVEAPKAYARPRGCEPGTRKACPAEISRLLGRPLTMECRRDWRGVWSYSQEDCSTPLVLSFDGGPVTFTDAPNDFPIGSWDRTEWVSGATPWLALDTDASGCIEGENELFGPPEGGTNGFQKLARLDDNHDGVIDARDRAFSSLVLWSDTDQDRRCRPSEVRRLQDAGIVAIELAYESPAPVGVGSREGEHATFLFSRGGQIQRGKVIDVYLAPLKPRD